MHKKELLNIDMQYSLNEICLLPSAIPTDITSRKQVNPFDENGNLPIFVAPMTSVLNESNYKIFADKGVIPILPRNCTETRDIAEVWHSYSLQEFESIIDSSKDYNGYHILIDVANGHMRKIYDLVKKAKEKWPNIVIMIGNIANPAIYYNCCDAGVDYVRVGIGGGCFTPESIVHTSSGDKKIKDITLEDKVLTHTNTYKKVIDLLQFQYTGKLYEINGIKCTPNHEFYVINTSDSDKVTDENISEYAFWIKAEDIDLNKHSLIQL